jgi:hypothetical protein
MSDPELAEDQHGCCALQLMDVDKPPITLDANISHRMHRVPRPELMDRTMGQIAHQTPLFLW